MTSGSAHLLIASRVTLVRFKREWGVGVCVGVGQVVTRARLAAGRKVLPVLGYDERIW